MRSRVDVRVVSGMEKGEPGGCQGVPFESGGRSHSDLTVPRPTLSLLQNSPRPRMTGFPVVPGESSIPHQPI
jgi:hypothetical protein